MRKSEQAAGEQAILLVLFLLTLGCNQSQDEGTRTIPPASEANVPDTSSMALSGVQSNLGLHADCTPYKCGMLLLHVKSALRNPVSNKSESGVVDTYSWDPVSQQSIKEDGQLTSAFKLAHRAWEDLLLSTGILTIKDEDKEDLGMILKDLVTARSNIESASKAAESADAEAALAEKPYCPTVPIVKRKIENAYEALQKAISDYTKFNQKLEKLIDRLLNRKFSDSDLDLVRQLRKAGRAVEDVNALIKESDAVIVKLLQSLSKFIENCEMP